MEKCSFPRCNKLPDYGYVGRDICTDHWNQLCLSDSKTEKRLLKKIGLTRDNSGSVVGLED